MFDYVQEMDPMENYPNVSSTFYCPPDKVLCHSCCDVLDSMTDPCSCTTNPDQPQVTNWDCPHGYAVQTLGHPADCPECTHKDQGCLYPNPCPCCELDDIPF